MESTSKYVFIWYKKQKKAPWELEDKVIAKMQLRFYLLYSFGALYVLK